MTTENDKSTNIRNKGITIQLTAEEFSDKIIELTDRMDLESEREDLMPYQSIEYSRKFFELSKVADITDEEKIYYKLLYLKDLLECGYRYKNSRDKKDNDAMRVFRHVLSLDKMNPQAHYRMAHISFREKKYLEAIGSFEKAIKNNEISDPLTFRLNKSQIDNAYKLMSFSALQLFESAKNHATSSKDYPELDSLILDYLNKEIGEIGSIIMHTILPNEEKPKNEAISKSRYSQWIDQSEKDSSFFYISLIDSLPQIGYMGKEQTLSYKSARFLRDQLIERNGDIYELITTRDNGSISNNTLRKTLGRMNYNRIGLDSDKFRITYTRNEGNKSEYVGHEPDIKITTGLKVLVFEFIDE